MLLDSDLRAIIAQDESGNLTAIMADLKDKYDGQYDEHVAIKIAREHIIKLEYRSKSW